MEGEGPLFGTGSGFRQELQFGLEIPISQEMGIQHALAGSFHGLRVVFAGQAENAQAGAVGLFRVTPGRQDGLDELGGDRADLLPPVQQPLGSTAVARSVSTRSDGWLAYALGRVEYLPGDGYCGDGSPPGCLGGRSPPSVRWRGFRLGLQQSAGHAVEVLLELDVVVNIHPGCLPDGEFIGLVRQRTQGRSIQFFEQLPARLAQVLHAPIVEGHPAAVSWPG